MSANGPQRTSFSCHLMSDFRARAGMGKSDANSLANWKDSLITQRNSLFRYTGNLDTSACICSRIRGPDRAERTFFAKYPVYFSVSRELNTRDRFACDCMRHHAVLLVSKVSDAATKASNLRAFAGRTRRSAVSAET